MAAETVILSAIENLDSWLLINPDIWYYDYEKMRSFMFDEKAVICSALVGMVDFREDKERLHSVLFRIMDCWKDGKENLYRLLVMVADPWKDNDNQENLSSFLLEMTDLWEDKKGKLQNKEKLHSLLVELVHLWEDDRNINFWEEKPYRLLVEMAGLWKDGKRKLNKVKLHSWVAEKTGHWEDNELFSLLLLTLRDMNNREYVYIHGTRDTVEGTKTELRLILDLIRDKKLEEEEGSSRLHYFISDVVDMVHDAHLLIQFVDSDPFILFLEIFIRDRQDHLYEGFLEKISFIQNGLRETKESMLELGAMATLNVGELEGGKDVVGLEEDMRLLLHNKNIGTTTFIRGMGGIGKTTLARELYNHPAVVDRFQCRAWLRLSRELSRKEVLMNLIQQVVDDSKEFERDDASSLEKMDNKSLKQMLHQQLQGMRYFIVLDDVSESALFRYVSQALPKDKGSRLLFTTRSADIDCDYYEDYNHEMKFLDDDKSWQLLLKTLFLDTTSDHKLPKNMEKKGREMLKKCNGLPLAIKEVGRQWATKRQSGSEWEELLVIESTDLGATFQTLASTYHNLDPEAKSCFLHLGFFKEGTTIRAKKLEQIWTTGRMVTSCQPSLHKLSEESIVEVKDMTKTNRGIKTFRINAVFHMLSITKAEDEISLEILRKDGNNRRSHEPRHRVIYCSREKFNYSTNQDKHLVSLFFHGGGYFDASPTYWEQFEQLKILDMEDFGLKMLPDAVGTLIELRYLGLRNNYIQELPHSLGHHKRLEVLDIAQNFMVEVPDIVWEMDSLRHLYMSDLIFQNPLKIDALKNLETLTYISVDNWTYELSGLQMMTSLRKLGIEEVDENSDVRKLFFSLAELFSLRYLTLRGFRFRSMPSLDELSILKSLVELKLNGQLTRLPSNLPQTIRYLSLVNSYLDEDPMPILEKHFNLYYLRLQNAYTGQQMVISPHGFDYLRHLVIGELWHLRNVQVGKGAMSLLQRLEINNCPYLEALPKEIALMTYLEELTMKTTKNIATKIREYSGFFSRISKVDIQP